MRNLFYYHLEGYMGIFLLVTLILTLLPEYSRGQNGYAEARFLLIPPDARGKAMANGGSIFSKGAGSAYYNPALLVTSDQFSTEANYCKHLPLISGDLSIKSLSFSRKYNEYGYIGIGYSRIDYQLYRRDIEDCPEWSDIFNYSLSLWTAIALDRHNSLGAGIKYIRSNVAGIGYLLYSTDEPAGSVAIDLGFLSRNQFPLATWENDEVFYPALNRLFKIDRDKGFSFGISLLNLGRDIEYDVFPYSESLPRLFRIAAGYQAVDSEPVGLRLTIDGTKLLVDVHDPFKEEWSEIAWSYGLESSFYYILTFRLGRLLDRGDHQRYNTIGFGLGPEWLGIDYSYVLESDEDWNRSGKEYSISIKCNIPPK